MSIFLDALSECKIFVGLVSRENGLGECGIKLESLPLHSRNWPDEEPWVGSGQGWLQQDLQRTSRGRDDVGLDLEDF